MKNVQNILLLLSTLLLGIVIGVIGTSYMKPKTPKSNPSLQKAGDSNILTLKPSNVDDRVAYFVGPDNKSYTALRNPKCSESICQISVTDELNSVYGGYKAEIISCENPSEIGDCY